jgi:hypothetical protein
MGGEECGGGGGGVSVGHGVVTVLVVTMVIHVAELVGGGGGGTVVVVSHGVVTMAVVVIVSVLEGVVVVTGGGGGAVVVVLHGVVVVVTGGGGGGVVVVVGVVVVLHGVVVVVTGGGGGVVVVVGVVVVSHGVEVGVGVVVVVSHGVVVVVSGCPALTEQARAATKYANTMTFILSRSRYTDTQKRVRLNLPNDGWPGRQLSLPTPESECGMERMRRYRKPNRKAKFPSCRGRQASPPHHLYLVRRRCLPCCCEPNSLSYDGTYGSRSASHPAVETGPTALVSTTQDIHRGRCKTSFRSDWCEVNDPASTTPLFPSDVQQCLSLLWSWPWWLARLWAKLGRISHPLPTL